MDDATKKMLLTIVTGVAKKAAIVISTALTAHGVAVTGSSTEYIASGLVLLVTLGYGVWTDYLKAIVLSQLEVLKAKSLAQAAALRDGGIKAPDAQAVAAASAKSPDVATLTVEEVKKAAATLPAAVAGATALLALFFVALTIATPALAQGPIARKIQQDIAVKTLGSGEDGGDLLGALEAKLLPDLKYALNVANGSGNDLTAGCWKAWIDMIEARQKANVDEQGNPIPMPDPALITKFQKLVDIRNALQPTSPFMRACSPVAQMVKSDIRKFIGMILTGGFGLAAMGIGL